MMKKWNFALPLFLGLVGAVLRFLQCRTVFEPDTMLSRPHPISVLLPIYLVLCAAFFAARWGRKETALDFDAAFTVPESRQLTGFVCSAMLFVAAGAYTIAVGGTYTAEEFREQGLADAFVEKPAMLTGYFRTMGFRL